MLYSGDYSITQGRTGQTFWEDRPTRDVQRAIQGNCGGRLSHPKDRAGVLYHVNFHLHKPSKTSHHLLPTPLMGVSFKNSTNSMDFCQSPQKISKPQPAGGGGRAKTQSILFPRGETNQKLCAPELEKKVRHLGSADMK